ncbi:MAG: hypothetical protein HY737_03450 [Candidatus Omnitrophica bacterium]|nr:hypothetical protein [Candidatus Omnitrophota bacterium]
MREMARCVLASVLVVSLLAVGCANQSRTVRTEQTVSSSSAVEPPPQRVVSEKETVETRTEVHRESQGILSTAVHVVGEIIALPFRLIGGLIRMIF